MNQINIPMGDGSIHLPADLVIKAALKHACGIDPDAEKAPAPAATELDIPPLGEYWSGEGGFNGGLFQGGDQPYYLIVADKEFTAEYGGYNHETEGADCPWNGLKNTKALLDDDEEHPAAAAAARHQADGHADFYLPARRELQVLEASVSQLFKPNYHWSSTQRSAHYAFSLDFEDGWQDYLGKNNERLVRPVRRINGCTSCIRGSRAGLLRLPARQAQHQKRTAV